MLTMCCGTPSSSVSTMRGSCELVVAGLVLHAWILNWDAGQGTGQAVDWAVTP